LNFAKAFNAENKEAEKTNQRCGISYSLAFCSAV